MLDIDHIDDPHAFFNSNIAPILNSTANCQAPAGGPADTSSRGRELIAAEVVDVVVQLSLVAITASGHGLRIIGERLQHESIEAAQLRIATALNISEYDAVTKDLARASYVVPSDYILYINTDALFSAPATSQVLRGPRQSSLCGVHLAVPTAVNPASSPTFTEDSATSPNRGPHELRERVGRGETAATLTNEGEFIVASQFRRRSGGN